MRPQPFSLVGDGGSIFRSSPAAALDMGMGINANDVPPRFQAKGLGSGRAKKVPQRDLVCGERRQLLQLDECHRRAGNLAKLRSPS